MGPALVTLAMGTILGYLAQRSRFCLIGGLRDFILVRDTELLKGALALFITAWVAFSVAGVFGLVDFPVSQIAGDSPRGRALRDNKHTSTATCSFYRSDTSDHLD